jgi:hypothetical protein
LALDFGVNLANMTSDTNSGNITAPSDTYENFHDFEIRWTPERIEWVIDGEVGRTQKKSDTWNETTNQWDYPQTPARVQLSIWPGGADTNAQGTIDWAGGKIDWDSEDIRRDKYYYATVAEVEIECYQTNNPPGTNKGTSYTYKDAKGTNDTVVDGDASTVLKSLLGSGIDMEKELPEDDNGETSEVIPGLSGGGPGTNGQAAGGSDGSSGTGTDGNQATGTDIAPTCTATGFNQDCSNPAGASSGGSGNGNGNTNVGIRQERTFGASAFAALIAVAGMLWL